MRTSAPPALEDDVVRRLEESGFRTTPQRAHVYRTLLEKRDHPTAEDVFIRAKRTMPDISMATVYNCLDALVQSNLVRLVSHDRGATRYCPNMKRHHHFYCDRCGGAFDIDEGPSMSRPRLDIPDGFQPDRYEIVVRGLCPDCAARAVKLHA
jgi:Fur family peroxide stress response transcriptional regulator